MSVSKEFGDNKLLLTILTAIFISVFVGQVKDWTQSSRDIDVMKQQIINIESSVDSLQAADITRNENFFEISERLTEIATTQRDILRRISALE